MSDPMKWLADAWWTVWWTLRRWFWTAYGTADRLWWRTRRRLFGPGPQSTLTVADSLAYRPGCKLSIESGMRRREVVRVVQAEGCAITVEGKPRIWRKR